MIGDLFVIQNSTFNKFYNPSKNLAVGEIILSFEGRVNFKQNMQKK
jgi:hypothetical protein